MTLSLFARLRGRAKPLEDRARAEATLSTNAPVGADPVDWALAQASCHIEEALVRTRGASNVKMLILFEHDGPTDEGGSGMIDIGFSSPFEMRDAALKHARSIEAAVNSAAGAATAPLN